MARRKIKTFIIVSYSDYPIEDANLKVVTQTKIFGT